MFNVGLNIAKETPTLCKRIRKQAELPVSSNKEQVTYHAGLVTINKYLNGLKSYIRSGNQKLPMNHAYKGTVDGLIRQTDSEFKTLKPTGQRLTLTRGIQQVTNENSPDYKLLQKQKQLKKGDILAMRGYAYAGPKEAGNPYIDNPYVSIIYEMDVPEKAKLSRDGRGEFIFPRYSRFEVLDNVEDNGVNKIKLKYILPE